MLRPPVAPKKRTPAVPEQPEIPAAWLEALNNSGTTVAPANAGTVSPRKQFTNIRQAEQAIDSRQQAEANYRAYYDKRVPVKTIAPYMGGDVYSDSVGQMIKFAGDNLIKEPAKSFYRTATLQNANTALNPFSDASAPERLMALGEDTLNIASAVPGVRAAAQASNPLKQAFKNAIFMRSAAGKQQLADQIRMASYNSIDNVSSRRAMALLNKEGDIQAKRSVMLTGLKNDSYARPEWYERLPGGKYYDPDIMRIWHTNQQGKRLPFPLNSMEESARMEGRRGSGASQLFSGGKYDSDSGSMSYTYFDEPQQFSGFPSYNVDDQYLENYLQLPSRNKITGFTDGRSDLNPFGMNRDEVYKDILDMQRNDYLSKIKNVDDPIGPDWGRVLWANPNLSVRQIIDNADSAEAAQAIVDRLPFPVSFKGQKWNVPEKIKFKYPVISSDGKKFVDSAIATNSDAVYIAGETARKGSPDHYWSKDLGDALRSKAAQWEKERIELFKKVYPDREHPGFTINPYQEALEEVMLTSNRPKWQALSGNHMGGQNYWDMPITRGPGGDITSAFGLPALDITDPNITQQSADKLGDLVREFIKKELPGSKNQQEINGIIERIKNIPNSQWGPTREFANIQMQIENLGENELTQFGAGEFTTKEKLWMFLRDNGVEVFPHQGGAMTSGQTHQAFVFNTPEKLPAGNYLPSTFEKLGEMADSLTSVREQKIRELSLLLAMKQNPRMGAEIMAEQQLNKGFDKLQEAKLAGIQSMLVGSANNRIRNDGR
jgi:hypothetical protein